MDEIRELVRVVAREEQPRAAHEEDLGLADVRRVQLVVHDHGARGVQGDATVLVAKAVGRSPIRVP